MPLVLKKSFRERIKDLPVLIDDKSASSPNFFRVSDVPQLLTKGKNLLRITGHPTNLKEGTQILIDVRDSNGNDIYYEIPDYIEDDKSRLISIYIYHDKGDDNTPNGEAIITLIGVASKREDGRAIPTGYKGKHNVRWQTKVNVDRDRKSITPIIFNPTTKLPQLSISESIEVYKNQPHSGTGLNRITQTGKVRYIFKGKTPIAQITDSSVFNQEMVGSSIVLSSFTEPATPISKNEPTNSNFFSGSIGKVLNASTVQLKNPYIASFLEREGLKHSYDSIEESNYTIQYSRSGSNVTTENERSFVNLSFSDVDPIAGIVDKVKVLQKSDGLPGEFELLNEVAVPYSSSFSVKIPMPSENLQDPKLLKIQYLNSIGEISRTETLSQPFVFAGGNQYIGGSKNLISGSLFISNTLGTGLEIGGASSGFMRSVGFEGQTSASLGKAPGGFVIYSGSGNLQMGADTLEGVGMQMIGDNDDRHFIFSTANGGNLDVKTDKFFIGTNNTQFISGSNSNIEISSSLFHLDPKNNSLVIGANATILADLSVNNIFSPAGTNINSSKAAITAQGFAKFTSASIGGIKLDDNKLFTGDGTYSNSNTGFYVDSGSQFSLGNKLVWNPTTQALVIRGQLQLSDGSDVGNALAAATSSNTSKTVALGASSYVVTFNSLGNQDPTGQTITLTATQQNHTGTVYYEFRKGGSLQSARGTSNTFVADQSNELPSSTTPVTYEVKTFEVASGGSAIANDTLTLFGVTAASSGSDGSAGVDAVTAFLTNEAHSFAANPDKSIVSFVGGTTDMEVFEGVTNKTSQYTFTRASTTSVSSSISGKTVTITSMGHDSGSVVVTATKGSTSLSKTMSLVKAIAGQTGSDGSDGARGTDGTSAKLLIGSLDSQVFAFDNVADTSSDPLEIFFSFQQQNLTAAIVASDLTITTAGGSNITNFDFNNASISSGTGIVSGSIIFSQALNNGGAAGTKSNLPINISATKDGLQDSVKIFKIEGGTSGVDGQSARTMILTNESHTFASQPNGSIISFTGGDTDVSVFTGTTNTTSAYTISSTSTTSVSSSISSNTVTVTSMGHDSGSLIITAVSASGAAGEVSLSKLMSLTKAKQGTDGDDGAAGSNAKTITVNAASQIFVKAQNGTISPSSIVISANGQNLTSAGAFSTSAGTLTSKTENSSGGSATVTSGNFVDGMVVTYTTAGGDGSLTDSVTLKELDEGSGAVSALLTNESHVLPASSVGVVSSYSNSGTSIDVYEGATQLDYDGSGTTNGHWTIGTPTISPAGKITVGSISDSTNTAVVGNHSAMDNSTDSVTITYPISGKTQNGTAFSFNKTQTLTKSKAGTDGTNGTNGVNGTSAKLLTITPNSQVFGFDNSVDTTATPSSIIFTVAQQNLAHTIDTGDITITKAGSSTLSTPSLSGTISGGTGQQTFTVPFSSLTKTDLPLTVSVSNNANNLSDTTKIFKVVGGDTGSDGSAGTDAVSAFLTNEAHTFAALNNGNIVSFVGGSTDMEVFEGVTNVTSQYTISSSRGPGVVASDSGNTVTISALSHDSGSLTITATKGSTSLNKTMSLVKSKQGTAGLAGADAKSVSIVADSQTFAFDNSVDTTATPSSVNFVVNQQNLSGTIATSDITITKAGGATFTTPSLGGSVSSGTGTRTFALPFSSFSKSDLPLNIAVSKDSLSDSSKVFKIVGGDTGSDGSAGTDAVTAFLTNESHTFAADFSGSIASFTGGSTDMEVFEGVSNETSNYTISSSRGPGVTATDSGNTVTVTGMTGDIGSVKITATKGSTSLNKTMSLVKSKQGGVGATGIGGENAKTVTTTAASQIFVKAQNGDISPASIVISANGQNLTQAGAFSTTTGTLSSTSTSANGGSTTVTSGNFVDGMVVTYTAHSNDGGLTDSITLKILDEGSGAVSALLTNESHVLPASSEGVVSSYSDSGTSINVYEGATQLDYDGTGTSSSHWTIGTPTISPAGKITVGSISDSTNTAVVANHSSMDNNTDSVTITYPISGKTQNGTEFSFNKTQTITKSKAGATGAAGSDSKTVSLTATSNVITYNAAGSSPSPSSTITLTATSQNFTNGFFKFTGDGISDETAYSDGSGANSDTFSFSVPSSYFSTPKSIRVGVSEANQSELAFDTVSIVAVQPGTSGTNGVSAITAFLTSDGDIVPAANDGTVSSFAGSGTEMIIFQGATDVSSAYNTVTKTNSSGVTSALSGKTLSISGLTPDSGTVIITATSASNDPGELSISKTYSIGKSKAGATGTAGSNAKTVTVGASSNIFVKAQDGTLSPSSITITANGQNLTANGAFSNSGGTLSSTSVSTSGGSTTVTSGNFSNGMVVTYTAASADGSITDSVTLNELDEGSGNITAILNNEAHVLPASAVGAVSSYANSGTTIRCFEGASTLAFVTGTPSAGEFTVSVGNTANITEGSITDSGTFCTIGNHSGAANGTDQYVITYTISGKTLNGTDFTTFTKTQSLTKSKVGATGPQGNPGNNNQDFSFLGASLTGIGPIGSAGLLMTSNVFGFHNGISGNNGALTDFTSFLDSGGNFYLGGNASGATNPTDGYFAWNNTDKSLLISGSKARIDVDKFFVGKSTTQFISGSNGNIEISSSKFHIKPDGDVIVRKVTADEGTIGGFELTDTQINSTNDNLILKASGQVTASTLLLTGGKVAGMPVSSDEISVGEVLKLKQSGQITGSSVLFSGGNIGGFQLENSSLYQGGNGDLIASASFNIKARFGDYGAVAPFEYEPKGASTSFYISNISTNLPTDKLDLILKSGTVLSASKGTTGTNNQDSMFTVSSQARDNAVVKSYNPVSQLLTLDTGFTLGSGANGSQVTTRKIDIIGGVTFSSPNFSGQNNKTTSITVPQKDVSNLLLSSSGNFKAKSGNIGDFTITKSDIELISSIESKTELFDFRVYNSVNWPSDAITNDLASENGGESLVLNVGGESWEVHSISNLGDSLSSDEGFGNYLAISASSKGSSNRVYEQSELSGLGMSTSVWPFNSDEGKARSLGYSYLPSTTNKFGKNESWFLEYFGGVSSIKSGDAGLENATVTFMSESISIANVSGIVFAATASFIGSTGNPSSPMYLLPSEKGNDIISAGNDMLNRETLRQTLLIDGGGNKGQHILSSVSSQILSTTDSQKNNYFETSTATVSVHGSNRPLPTKTGVSLSSNLHLDPATLIKMKASVSSSTLLPTVEGEMKSGDYWTTQNNGGTTLSDVVTQAPFLYFGQEIDPYSIQKILYSVINDLSNVGSSKDWTESEFSLEYLREYGAKYSATASVSYVPYYPVLGYTTAFNNDGDGLKERYSRNEGSGQYVTNASLAEMGRFGEEYPQFPTYFSSSVAAEGWVEAIKKGDATSIKLNNIEPKNRVEKGVGAGGHIMILSEGWYINPLLDKVFQNNGNPININNEFSSGLTEGVGSIGTLDDTHKTKIESTTYSNSFPINWQRFGGDYDAVTSTTSNSAGDYRGFPFVLNHNFVSGSYTLGSKAIIKGGIFPTDVNSRGTFPSSPSDPTKNTQTFGYNDTSAAGPPAGTKQYVSARSYSFPFNLNGLLNSNYFGFGNSEGDISITNRIGPTEVQTDASTTFQNAWFDFTQGYSNFDMPFSLAFAEKVTFGDGTIRMGTLSGSFSEGSILKISGSGEISSSQYIQKSDGQVTGSKINFTGGRISGSDMTIFANEFDFKTQGGRVQGNETTFEISSSLLSLTPTSLDVKGNIQAENLYGQDTFLAGKIVETSVNNPTITSVKYKLPFVESYSKDSNDTRLTGSDNIIMNGATLPLHFTSGSSITGNHQNFTTTGQFASSTQFLTKVTNDGIGYPKEFKSWKDISGVNNDYVYVANTDARTPGEASGSLSTKLIGNQLVFNDATSSKLLFNSASNSFSTIQSSFIDVNDILSENQRNVHIQFGIRGTAHPSTGSFSGFNPEYKVEVLQQSGSFESIVWEKSYKDTSATNAKWTIFDVPMTDVVLSYTSESIYKQHPYPVNIVGIEFTGSNSYQGGDVGLKIKISARYSGSRLMTSRLEEGRRFGGSQAETGSFPLGFALTEMRMVEPARAVSLDTQTLHLKDTYLTWHENKETTGHYGNFLPEFKSTDITSSFSLGSPKSKWNQLFLNLKENNDYPVKTLKNEVSQSNKFVRINTHTGQLSFTSASAGSGGGGGSSLQLGTTSTTALAGDTTLLQLGTTSTTALAGNTTIPSNTFRTVTVDSTGNGSANYTLGSTETLMLKKGTNISLSESGGTVTISSTDNNTTYSVQDGELSQKNFTTTLKTKLDGITESADVNRTDAAIKTSIGTGNGKFVPSVGTSGHFLKHDGTFGLPSYITNTDTQLSGEDITKLGFIKTDTNTVTTLKISDGETARSGALTLIEGDNITLSEKSAGNFNIESKDTTYSVGDGGLTQKNFTSTLKTKLDGITASADVNLTAAEMRTAIGTGNGNLVPSAGTSGHFLRHDGTFGLPSYTTNTNTVTTLKIKGDENARSGALTLIEGDNITLSEKSSGNFTIAATDTNTQNTAAQIRTKIGSGNNGHVPSVGTSGHFLKHDGTFGLPSYTTNTKLTSTEIATMGFIKTAGTSTTVQNTADGTEYDGTITLIGGTNVSLTNSKGVFTFASTNTTYSVGDGGLTQKNFTSTLKTKLDGITASADVNRTAAQTRTLLGTGNGNLVPSAGTSGHFLKHDGTFGLPSYTTNTDTQLVDADIAKMGYIKSAGTTTTVQNTADGDEYDGTITLIGGTNVSLTNSKGVFTFASTDTNTTYSVGDGGLTQKNFTTTLKTKLDGIATSANNYSFPYTVSAAAGNSTVVQRNGSGYIFGNYLNMTGTFSNSGAGGTMGFFTGTNGTDNYGRGWTAAQARTLLNVADGATKVTDNSQIANGRGYITSYTDTNTFRGIRVDTTGNGDANNTLGASETLMLKKGNNISLSESGGVITISSTDTNTNTQRSDEDITGVITKAGFKTTDNNTTYTADGNWGLALSGTTFRLENDRRRNSTSSDVYSGNTHDYTFYDADVGIRWYTAGSEEMRLLDNGTLHVDGDVVAYSSTVSDKRLKDNVFTITSALDKVTKLRGVEYIWNNGARKGQSDIGFIAQEVEEVIPQIVREHTIPFLDGEDDTTYKTVDYEKVTALLIEAVKEQSDIIEKLEKRIKNLEKGSNN